MKDIDKINVQSKAIDFLDKWASEKGHDDWEDFCGQNDSHLDYLPEIMAEFANIRPVDPPEVIYERWITTEDLEKGRYNTVASVTPLGDGYEKYQIIRKPKVKEL